MARSVAYYRIALMRHREGNVKGVKEGKVYFRRDAMHLKIDVLCRNG